MINQKLLNSIVKHDDHKKACMDTWSELEKRLDQVCECVNIGPSRLWKFKLNDRTYKDKKEED